MIRHQLKILFFFSCNGNELASFYDQNHDRLIYWILIIMTLIDIATHHGLHNLFPPIVNVQQPQKLDGRPEYCCRACWGRSSPGENDNDLENRLKMMLYFCPKIGIAESQFCLTSTLLQVYMYTHTGLMDKKSNWFTHFIGMFLRPKDFMVNIAPFDWI